VQRLNSLDQMIETRTPEEVATRLHDSHKEVLSGIVAIDGRDGAGKSCLAKNLQKLIGGAIVSFDDFLEQNQGGYVEYLNITAIRAALDQVTTPKIR
jgi:chloramphenicol 3-O-phosphotransferase